jgi:hypothetical protein
LPFILIYSELIFGSGLRLYFINEHSKRYK